MKKLHPIAQQWLTWRGLFCLGLVLVAALGTVHCGEPGVCAQDQDCNGYEAGKLPHCVESRCSECKTDTHCPSDKGTCNAGKCVIQEEGDGGEATKETVKEASEENDEEIVLPEFRPEAERFPEKRPEPQPELIEEKKPEATNPETSRPEEATTEKKPENPVGENGCPLGQLRWQGMCYAPQDYCTTRFNTPVALKAMNLTAPLQYDANGTAFCQTNLGYYYLGGFYAECDADKDDFINIEAYRALNSVEQVIKDNARCDLKTIHALVYHRDPGAVDDRLKLPKGGQVQMLAQPIPLIETYRNDGGLDVTEIPVYTKDQAPLPKTRGADCQKDADCTNNKLCYIGHCLDGYRFQPREINTFTKVCIKDMDLNDNKNDDHNETTSGTPNPPDFKPLLIGAYFMELHYGKFESQFDLATITGAGMPAPTDVYHIYERPRKPGAMSNPQSLALRCHESSTANIKTPAYWRSCSLKDDQTCLDSNGQPKKGLSSCWLPDVQVALPSLFKCAVFSDTGSPTAFKADNYGTGAGKVYTRTTCNVTGSLTAAGFNDIQLDCAADSGQAPIPANAEVGWACVHYDPTASKIGYAKASDYIAGCVHECVEDGLACRQPLCVTEEQSYGQGYCETFSPGGLWCMGGYSENTSNKVTLFHRPAGYGLSEDTSSQVVIFGGLSP